MALVAIAVTVLGCVAAGHRATAGCWTRVRCVETTPVGVDVRQILVSRDERSLTVLGFGPCVGRFHLEVVERPDAVRLTGRVTRDLAETCPAGAGSMPIRTWQFRLAAPVAGRPVVDAYDGRRLAWIGGSVLLEPTFTPPGYGDHRVDPFTLPANVIGDGHGLCYADTYTAGDGSLLTVGQCPDRPVPSGMIVARVAAAGTTASVLGPSPVPFRHSWITLRWATGGRMVVVSSFAGPDVLPLPVPVLVAVANGLH